MSAAASSAQCAPLDAPENANCKEPATDPSCWPPSCSKAAGPGLPSSHGLPFGVWLGMLCSRATTAG
eukprot:8899454-Alexandrium_andersonii.AAC.1